MFFFSIKCSNFQLISPLLSYCRNVALSFKYFLINSIQSKLDKDDLATCFLDNGDTENSLKGMNIYNIHCTFSYGDICLSPVSNWLGGGSLLFDKNDFQSNMHDMWLQNFAVLDHRTL